MCPTCLCPFAAHFSLKQSVLVKRPTVLYSHRFLVPWVKAENRFDRKLGRSLSLFEQENSVLLIPITTAHMFNLHDSYLSIVTNVFDIVTKHIFHIVE